MLNKRYSYDFQYVCDLQTKDARFWDEVLSDLDIICLSKTWLYSNISSSEFPPPNVSISVIEIQHVISVNTQEKTLRFILVNIFSKIYITIQSN